MKAFDHVGWMPLAVQLSAVALISAAGLQACRTDSPLVVDDRGRVSGSGIKNYHYQSGALKLREQYENGKQVRSEWFKPDGTLIQTTQWLDGSGEGLYLREDGTIRVRMQYVHGVADGEAIYYSPDGAVERRVVFREGSPETEAAPTSR